MIVAIPVTDDGRTGGGWGRAPRVALATVADGVIADWQVHDVAWDVLHDTGTEGSHHARVARFLIEHQVSDVVVAHLGPGMQRMLAGMHITVHTAADPDARTAVLGAAVA